MPRSSGDDAASGRPCERTGCLVTSRAPRGPPSQGARGPAPRDDDIEDAMPERVLQRIVVRVRGEFDRGVEAPVPVPLEHEAPARRMDPELALRDPGHLCGHEDRGLREDDVREGILRVHRLVDDGPGGFRAGLAAPGREADDERLARAWACAPAASGGRAGAADRAPGFAIRPASIRYRGIPTNSSRPSTRTAGPNLSLSFSSWGRLASGSFTSTETSDRKS